MVSQEIRPLFDYQNMVIFGLETEEGVVLLCKDWQRLFCVHLLPRESHKGLS